MVNLEETLVARMVKQEKSAEQLERELAQNPENARLREDLTIALLGDPSKARQIIRMAPVKTPLLRYLRVMTFIKESKRWEECIVELRAIIDETPLFIEARISLGTLLNRCKRYQEAIDVAREVLLMDARMTDAWFILSKAYLNLHEEERALRAMKGAIRGIDYGFSISAITTSKRRVKEGYLSSFFEFLLERGRVHEAREELADLEEIATLPDAPGTFILLLNVVQQLNDGQKMNALLLKASEHTNPLDGVMGEAFKIAARRYDMILVQKLALQLARLTEPMVFVQLFPALIQMMIHVGWPKDKFIEFMEWVSQQREFVHAMAFISQMMR